ncbi:PPOX class F420-dependent oxidoreductase [Saccharopolyspora rosea]|uniref:PPOX class F420-dependent oxidoreductase n=1 Tax=Saccharopolyspora rosea TaxID=524884 RepID=A0ABW3FP91_9PSEU
MPKPPLPEKVSDLLAKPNPSVITTVRQDGQPVSVATWYLWENGRVLVNMDEGRKRLDYLRADPRVTLTVLDADNWYTHVSLQGRVVELQDDPDLTDIDRLARHYTGEQYPVRDRRRVSAWIEVSRWHGWGAAENKDVEHH